MEIGVNFLNTRFQNLILIRWQRLPKANFDPNVLTIL
jgi:hypothetical protein